MATRPVIATRPVTRGRRLPVGGPGQSPPSRVSPFVEIGASGVQVYGGRIITREKSTLVTGPRKWSTYADLVTNTSIVAASVRYFLNVVASAKWHAEPPVDTPAAKEVAELVDSIVNDMSAPWNRVVRRASSYRFNGFGFHEWTAKKRPDGKVGLENVEVRPCHTLDRWVVDDNGEVKGFWQRAPQTGDVRWLPRQKLLYLVDDSLSDSPEGIGLYRHLIDPYIRLKKLEGLEIVGYERDLRGIPIGRVPYAAIRQAVKNNTMTQADGEKAIRAIEEFVSMQSKQEDTSIVLDSAPYMVETDSGMSMSGVYQYGLELLQGAQPGFGDLNAALQRLNREMARVIGTEHLLLGESAGSRALSEDKSRNFYLVDNGTLDEIGTSCDKDIVTRVCDLNGIPEDLRPKLQHSDISFRAVTEVTTVLGQMAQAGAVLAPDDPAINDVRHMVGLPDQPPVPPGMLGMLGDPAKERALAGEGDAEDLPGDEGVEGVSGAKGTRTTPKVKRTPTLRKRAKVRKRPTTGR